jgi:hypothetical protein
MEGSRSGSVPLTYRSGSRRPIHLRILRIRIRNTVGNKRFRIHETDAIIRYLWYLHAGKIYHDLQRKRWLSELFFKITCGFLEAFSESKLQLQGLAKFVGRIFK